MLRRKKLYTVCISCILAFVMIFTSAGFGNTVYGNEAENVSYEGEVQTKADNAGTLKPMIQKTEIVDSVYEADNERESIARLYSASSEWSKYSSDYYYNMLADNEKILYDRLEASVLKYAESSDNVSNVKFGNEYYTDNVNCKDLELTNERVQFVVELFYQTESQYFFLKNEWSVSKTSDGRVVAAAIAVYDEFVDGNVRQAYIAQFKSVINEWISKAENANDSYEKVKNIHDLICENIEYKAGDYDQSAASALLNYGAMKRATVCTGYAKAFQILCNGMGIDTIITVSTTHAWNEVNIDGYWYITDCTYDDSFYQYGRALYLAISTETLREVSNNDSAHDIREDWLLYQPLCLYDYGKDKNDVVYNIGDAVNATLNGDGILTVEGSGGTYDYAKGESPISSSEYNYGIKEVIIDSGVTVIGDYVFADGYYDTIELPDSLLSWSDKAFSGSYNITKIINKSLISKSMTILGEQSDKYVWMDDMGVTVSQIPAKTVIKRGIITDNADSYINGLKPADNGVWYLYRDGNIVYGYTGIVYDEAVGWWYVENGAVNFGYNGLKSNENGWWKIRDGAVDFDYTGIVYDETVGWWYVENGAVSFGYNGLKNNENGWWKIRDGAVDFGYTGIVYDETVGWWYVENGAVNFGYNGLKSNENGWWKIRDGAVDFGYTGIVYDETVGWWYVENGAVNFGYNGLKSNENGWWKIRDGAVDFGYTGIVYDETVGWWYVENGAVNFEYNSLSENEYGLWKVTNGTVDFGFNGQIEYEGIVYNIVNGHAE